MMSNRFVQTLEARRLMATVVTIQGTPGPDSIEIGLDSGVFTVTVNGTATTYSSDTVYSFEVISGAGNDIIVAGGLDRGLTIDGGDGDDKIVGSDGPDTILGAAGKDQIYGGGGNDRINGAGGKDKLFGEAGADRIYGGAADDYIDGGSSNDRLYPNDGVDSVYCQSGNDTVYGSDTAADQLFGGSGVDTGFIDGADARFSIEQVVLI